MERLSGNILFRAQYTSGTSLSPQLPTRRKPHPSLLLFCTCLVRLSVLCRPPRGKLPPGSDSRQPLGGAVYVHHSRSPPGQIPVSGI